MPPIKKFMLGVGWVLVLPIAFTSIYQLMSYEKHPWLPPLLVNSGLVFIMCAFTKSRQSLIQSLQKKSLPRYYLPSALIVLFIGGAVTYSASMGGRAFGFNLDMTQLGPVLLVPVCEEIVFRLGIGGYMRQISGRSVGSYLSALIFSLCHTMPSIYDIFNLSLTVPLGAFLLGITTEWLFCKSNSLIPGIVLHIVCNLSGVVFLFYDPRWLKWLEIFYL